MTYETNYAIRLPGRNVLSAFLDYACTSCKATMSTSRGLQYKEVQLRRMGRDENIKVTMLRMIDQLHIADVFCCDSR